MVFFFVAGLSWLALILIKDHIGAIKYSLPKSSNVKGVSECSVSHNYLHRLAVNLHSALSCLLTPLKEGSIHIDVHLGTTRTPRIQHLQRRMGQNIATKSLTNGSVTGEMPDNTPFKAKVLRTICFRRL